MRTSSSAPSAQPAKLSTPSKPRRTSLVDDGAAVLIAIGTISAASRSARSGGVTIAGASTVGGTYTEAAERSGAAASACCAAFFFAGCSAGRAAAASPCAPCAEGGGASARFLPCDARYGRRFCAGVGGAAPACDCAGSGILPGSSASSFGAAPSRSRASWPEGCGSGAGAEGFAEWLRRSFLSRSSSSGSERRMVSRLTPSWSASTASSAGVITTRCAFASLRAPPKEAPPVAFDPRFALASLDDSFAAPACFAAAPPPARLRPGALSGAAAAASDAAPLAARGPFCAAAPPRPLCADAAAPFWPACAPPLARSCAP